MSDIREYTQRVKDHKSTLEIFRLFNFHSGGEQREGNETRLPGNGGLKIKDNGEWWNFAGTVGGYTVEAWYYCRTSGKAMPQTEFMPTVFEMGDNYGFDRPEQSEEAKAAYEERRNIEEIYALAADYYHEQLPKEQREWLHTRYGLTDETINNLKLGYAPASDSNLFVYLRKVHKITTEDLLKTGLFRQNDYGIQDAFQGRILFPYWNRSKPVYFIGRETDQTPQWEKERGMKYSKLLTHNDTHAYVSEQVQNEYFYGEDSIRGKDTVFITEGVTDCIIANQHGFPCVSPVTTSFRDADHPKLIELTKHAKTIYIINDNEENGSGRNGALRTADALWSAGKMAQFVELPRPAGLDKIDLNDFLRQFGADELKKLFPTSKTLLDIYIETAIKANAGTDKSTALRDVFRLIAQIEDKFQRSQWRKDLPKKLGISKADYDEFTAELTAKLQGEAAQDSQESIGDHLDKATGKKVRIQANNRQLDDMTNEAIGAIRTWIIENPTCPPLYVRGGILVKVVADEDTGYTVQVVKAGALRGILSDVAFWYNINSDDGKQSITNVFPPEAVVKNILERGEWPGFPTLDSVVNTPVFGREGMLHMEHGYSNLTRLFHASVVTVGDIAPTPENIAKAKDLLLCELLCDFPFKDDSSKAHAIAYLLLPFARLMIHGPTPLHLINSPTPGTGKGKLINACAFPALGYDVPTMTEAQTDDEWRKRLTTVLMSGRSHVVIDNVNHGLNSGDLASALTQPVWNDRTLGANQEVNIKIRTAWAASGNNVPVSEELARRCALIQLDANVEKPWERTGFKHADLMSWARANRNELVTAAITLINAWICSGKPMFTGKVKGSYEAWTNVMGGILQTAGIPGFLENESTMFEAAVSKTQVLADFVKEWWAKYQGNKTSADDLFKLASHADDPSVQAIGQYSGLLDEILGAGNQRSRQIKLGKILAENKDKVIAGYKIVFDGVSRGTKYHRLEVSGECANNIHHHDSTILPLENDGNTKSSGECGECDIPYIPGAEEEKNIFSVEEENIIFSHGHSTTESKTSTTSTTSTTHSPRPAVADPARRNGKTEVLHLGHYNDPKFGTKEEIDL